MAVGSAVSVVSTTKLMTFSPLEKVQLFLLTIEFATDTEQGTARPWRRRCNSAAPPSEQSQGGVFKVSSSTIGGPFAAVQTGFQESQAAQLAFYESAAGGSLTPAAAQQLIVQGYHGAVAPFCTAAARAFFSPL